MRQKVALPPWAISRLQGNWQEASLLLLLILMIGTTALWVRASPASTPTLLSLVAAQQQVGERESEEQSPATVKQTPVATGGLQVSFKGITRLAQLDGAEYASQQEHRLWSPSACSVAALAMLFNGYSTQRYRITDVLQVARKLEVISTSKGLLAAEGIDLIASRFGFETRRLEEPLSALLARANKGEPLLVNFPPQPGTVWAGGHFLVFLGGSLKGIKLADSSGVNGGKGLTVVDEGYFKQFWRGKSWLITPSHYLLTNKPTATVQAINAMLTQYQSPVAGQGQMIYDMSAKNGLDPAFLVAIFGMESSFGTKGVAKVSHSPGNLRCIKTARCDGGYAHFPSWREGFVAMAELLSGPLYAKDRLIIPESIIPRYAPAADNNDERAYIATIKQIMDVLRSH